MATKHEGLISGMKKKRKQNKTKWNKKSFFFIHITYVLHISTTWMIENIHKYIFFY